MSAGTLTLTNNSAAVPGVGTAFTTELAAGDFIVVTVGGVPYTLPVRAVHSNTALTLVSNYTGPTQSGAAWYAVPRVALNMVTAALVAQSTEALRGLNYDKQNWQAVFSADGNITVFLPDGTSFSGPSWKNIVTMLSESLKRSQNLSDLADRDAAWLNILPIGSTISDDASGANTLWSVINEDAEMPRAATSADGGFVQSQYKVNGVVVAESRMRAVATVGGNYSTRITTHNVTDSKSAEWIFGDDGTLTLPPGPVQLKSSSPGRAFRIDGYTQADSLFAIAGSAVGVVAGESNEIRMQNFTAGSGNYVNSITGRWYKGAWTCGGIRGNSQDLLRVQLNVSSGTGAVASFMFRNDGTGQAAKWQNTSDRRIKSCIETIPDPLVLMREMRGYSWYYEPYGTQGFGFMADEVEKHFPGAVKGSGIDVEMPDGFKVEDVKAVDTYGIAAALHHEAILVMMEQIAELKAEIKKLKGE